MARFNTRDVIQAISVENQAKGTYLIGDVGDHFRKFPSNPINPVIPQRTYVADNSVGDGNPNDRKEKPYWFDPVQIPYAMALNSTMAVRLLRVLSGGAATTTTNAVPGTKDHAIIMKTIGSEPMMFNLLRKLGGEQFLWGDVFVQNMDFSQDGAGEPQVSANMSNSGYHRLISDTSIDVADVQDMDAFLKYHGAKTRLTFSDGVDSYDWAAGSRLLSVGCTLNQNVVVEQLIGDPFLNTAECQGAYSKSIFKDKPTAEMKAKVAMDASFAEFTSWLNDRTVTSVKLIFQTCEIIGSTTHHAEIEIEFPQGQFKLTGDQDKNNSAFNFMIKAINGDASSESLWLVRIRQVAVIDEVWV